MQLSIDQKDIDKFLMIGDKVLIKPKNPQSQTKTGLYLPPSLQAREGDLAVYLQNAAYEINFNDEKFLIVPHSAILMLVRDEGLFE